MCGIAGLAGVNLPGVVAAMCQRMAHRGPDDAGLWSDPAAAVELGHRRLAIIDLSPAGHQPMVSDGGDMVLVFNGEIYDYARHRADLEREGVTFRGGSDTEVLLRLYERHGLDLLQRVNGMFAFALWDGRSRELVLARDHAGIKPLYYHVQNGILSFASEFKALLALPGLSTEINTEALGDLLTFLWVPGEECMLKGVRKLYPGHVLRWRAGEVEVRPWFRLRYEPETGRSEADWVEEVRSTFIAATRRQMVSDVPLGAFLSGGLDSSAIVACMRAAFPDREIRAYTARAPRGLMTEDQGGDDYPFARRVAHSLGVNLKSVDLSPALLRLLPAMVYHLDEPDADPAILPSYLISRLARDDGTTVLMSGTGGDEVFFGYRSHRAYRYYERTAGPGRLMLERSVRAASLLSRGVLGSRHRLSRRLGKLYRGLVATPGLERHLALVDWSSPEARAGLLMGGGGPSLAEGGARARLRYFSDLFSGVGALNFHTHLLINTFLAAHNFLYTDKTSMAASVEVRVPFMDREVMDLAARIPEDLKLRGRETKYVLKRAMEPYLPRDIIYRRKVGFGMPIRRWLMGELGPEIHEWLGPARLRSRGLFEPAAVAEVLRQQRAGEQDHTYLIFALVYLELWMQTFLDRRGEPVTL